MGYLGAKILNQWRASRPQMVKQLEESRTLEEIVSNAEERVIEEMHWLTQRGTPWHQAEEVALSKVFLPDEEQETLTPDQILFLS